ncbi:hypothetical protein ANCCAN_28391 [Ancylostoma caninum]|uniref:Uncharacterized protein n=1 Tax=Ancylostoma caninum TaxID=29170 RepID=A0A368F1G4_ANCCA|nr:hypothetical protein ANCCAN_28391 [Ancylostoma caninum]
MMLAVFFRISTLLLKKKFTTSSGGISMGIWTLIWIRRCIFSLLEDMSSQTREAISSLSHWLDSTTISRPPAILDTRVSPSLLSSFIQPLPTPSTLSP